MIASPHPRPAYCKCPLSLSLSLSLCCEDQNRTKHWHWERNCLKDETSRGHKGHSETNLIRKSKTTPTNNPRHSSFVQKCSCPCLCATVHFLNERREKRTGHGSVGCHGFNLSAFVCVCVCVLWLGYTTKAYCLHSHPAFACSLTCPSFVASLFNLRLIQYCQGIKDMFIPTVWGEVDKKDDPFEIQPTTCGCSLM